MKALATLLLIAHLSVHVYRFLLAKTSTVPQDYDVFLNFRGIDTRLGFTDFLYNSLVAAESRVFRDDKELQYGEEIGPGISRAIENCRIAIPIISEQYAQSYWCLEELTQIMDRHRKQGIFVFPIFYKVDVVDVLRQRGGFKKALDDHRKGKFRSKVPEWEKALTSVAGIKGWISQTVFNGDEGELVKMVVARVSSELKTTLIERPSIFPFLMSNHRIRSGKKRRESKWQVFLAFHGPDTRCGFAAFLHFSLVAQGIRVFRDDDPSLIGTDVNLETRNAIDHCRISIPIFSTNYASSRWRLQELSQMVERKRENGQHILPIFYKVKPYQVREVSGSFAEHMDEHKKQVDKGTYELWEKALKGVGSLTGWESEKTANGREGELVKMVVQKVSDLLKNPRTHDPPSPSAKS